MKPKELALAVAIAVIGLGIYFGWPEDRSPRTHFSTPASNTSLMQRPASAQPTGTWDFATIIVPTDQDYFNTLCGSWRWIGSQGFSSTYAFDPNGTFTYYLSGNTLINNLPAAFSGEVYGRWSVRDATLYVEFVNASHDALIPLFRGRTAQSPIVFPDRQSVNLSGIEGDNQTRRYIRIR